jgi:hypothetical protein
MLQKYLSWLAAATVLLTGSTAVLAHHGISTKFNPEQTVTLKGRVSRMDWSNPHAHIFMLVKDGSLEIPWYVELESPQLLELNGWTETVLKPGDLITVQGFSARDASHQVWGDSITVDSTGQTILGLTKPTLFSTITDQPARETPRWPDGTPRLGAAPGDAGYWVPSTSVLMEDGTNIAMAANGQLENIADAAKVAPLQKWALRLYEKRQREFLASDPTYLECRPPAGPRKFLEPYGIQLLEDKPMQRIFVIAGGGNHDWQLIYTDGRALDGGFQLDDGNLLYYGRNVGAWEGNTFVIESEGFNERFWLPGGLPHSTQMHVTERLTRVDYNTMNYELTINDPGTYTRPWKSSWTLKWLDGQDPPEHYCQDNRL